MAKVYFIIILANVGAQTILVSANINGNNVKVRLDLKNKSFMPPGSSAKFYSSFVSKSSLSFRAWSKSLGSKKVYVYRSMYSSE